MVTEVAGRYQLVREIGSGGMGRVFQALDTQSGKTVAAKVLIAGREIDIQALARFANEGAVLAALKHPNIVQVYGTHLQEDLSCIIMEFLEGQTLAEILRTGQLPPVRAKQLMLQVAAALAYAHSKGVIHRDVKPDNIMLVGDDHVKVTDFGIARIVQEGVTFATLSSTGSRIGTPLYMSPEQIEGQKVDGRSDIYSLGCVLYQLVTGEPPFEGGDPLTVAFKHVHKAPKSPGHINAELPDDWEVLILRCLAKNPANRYQSTAALEEALGCLSTDWQHAPAQGREVDATDELADEAEETIQLEQESRALLNHGKTKELSGDFGDALRDYRAALTVASAGRTRDEVEAAIARVTAKLRSQTGSTVSGRMHPVTDARRLLEAARRLHFGVGAIAVGVIALIVAGVIIAAQRHGNGPSPDARATATSVTLDREYGKYRTLAVALTDLPRGFKQTRGRFVTNAEVAATTRTPLTTIEHQGRVISYRTAFSRRSLAGVTGVDDNVVVFKSGSMAHAGFRRALSIMTKVHPMALSRLGDEHFGSISTRSVAGADVTTVLILFRRDVYRAAINAAGYGRRATRDHAIHLARIMDQRIAEQVALVPTPIPAPTAYVAPTQALAPTPVRAPTASLCKVNC